MSDKPYEIVDGTIHPKKKTYQPADETGEITGDYWRVWKEEAKHFLEYDEGHFAPKMVTIEISKDEYDLISTRPTVVKEIIRARQAG